MDRTNRRLFLAKWGRFAAALPFVGAAQRAQRPAETLISYGPATANGALVYGRGGLQYDLWLNEVKIAQGPVAQIVARADALAKAVFGR